MKKRFIWWALVILWCAFIFYQSAKPAVDSERESSYAVSVINTILNSLLGQGMLQISDTLVRKSAHFLEYTVLGCLLYNAFRKKVVFDRAFVLSVVLGIFYSVSDEVHQYFVPGRSMRAFDVMIDSIGIFIGVILSFAILKKREYRFWINVC